MAPPPPMSFKEQMDGFPWSQILVISVVRLAEPIAFTSLFTYVYFMVEDFGIAETKAEVSKYAGFLAAAFAMCQVLTAVFWGKFADKYGRKPALIIGLTGSMASVLIFGFAKSYGTALFARALMGLLNGNVAVIRTMLGELTTEKRHQILAFSVMPVIWSLGSVIGPLIGGYLSGKTTSIVFLKAFVEKFPYARPNILIAFLLLFSTVVALFFLEETHQRHKYRRDVLVELGDKLLFSKFGRVPVLRPWQDRFAEQDYEDESIPLRDLSTAGSSEFDIEDEEPTKTKKDGSTQTRVNTINESDDEEGASLKEIMSVPVIAALSAIFITSAHAVACDEFIPVFLSTEVSRSKDGSLLSKFPFHLVGGLSYQSQETGTLLSTTGMISVLFIVLVLPHMTRKYDTVTIYKIFCLPFPLIYFSFPYLVLLADHSTLAKVLVYANCGIRSVCLNLAFPQLNFLVHACAPPGRRAFVNGISISVGSLARFMSPFLFGFIMTFGQVHEIAWLGWWVLAGLSMVAIYMRSNLTEEYIAKDSVDFSGERETIHVD